jgi:hypothetical protein
MVTVGGVAAQVVSDKSAVQTTPKILESFIVLGLPVFVMN